MKRWCLALLLLSGCQAGPAPTATTSTPAARIAENQGWFTYFAPDGSYSVQFPKAPESVGNNPQARLLAHGLDHQGSNLSLIQMPLPDDLNAQTASKNPAKFFAQKDLKIVGSSQAEWSGHAGVKLEMESQGNRVWVHMIFAKPWLYQLVALQTSQSSQDYGPEREQFFASFQFTQKK
jgi:hypothetical protein